MTLAQTTSIPTPPPTPLCDRFTGPWSRNQQHCQLQIRPLGRRSPIAPPALGSPSLAHIHLATEPALSPPPAIYAPSPAVLSWMRPLVLILSNTFIDMDDNSTSSLLLAFVPHNLILLVSNCFAILSWFDIKYRCKIFKYRCIEWMQSDQ